MSVIKLNDIMEEEDQDVNGEEADLQEGDLCSAPYEDGEIYVAKIVFRTGEIYSYVSILERLFQIYRQY